MVTKTYMAKTGEIASKWLLVDATDQVVGRLAAKIARILMGKHRVEYTPHVAMGDFVVVINAAKVKVTGSSKLSQRDLPALQRLSGRAEVRPAEGDAGQAPGEASSKRPSAACCPRASWRKVMFSRLKVYAGGEHPHQAQQPQVLAL